MGCACESRGTLFRFPKGFMPEPEEHISLFLPCDLCYTVRAGCPGRDGFLIYKDFHMKTIVTSDIHGCCTELKALLVKCALKEAEDRLVILGDLFDRGRECCEVFLYLRALKERMGERLILVRGNHDQFLIDAAKNPDTVRLWYLNGGQKTVESFRNHGIPIAGAADFLADTPYFCRLEDFIGVHAGLADTEPEYEDPEVLMWDRGVLEGRYKGPLAIGGHTPLKNPAWFLPDGRSLVLPYGRSMPLPDKGFICIDTGCVYGNRLTGLIIEENEFRLEEIPSSHAVNGD